MMDFMNKAWMVITDPTAFFKDVNADKDYMKPWLYYMAIFVINSLVSFLVSIPYYLMPWNKDELLFSVPVMILVLFFIYLLSMAFSTGLVFVSAAIAHLFLLIVGADKGYLQTFKLVCYSSTAGLLLAPFGLLTAFSIPGLILYYLVLFCFVAYIWYIQVAAARILHGLSLGRAVMGIIVIPLAVFLVLVAIIAVLMVGLIFMVASSGGITGMIAGSVI
jgi:hypothetical protein